MEDLTEAYLSVYETNDNLNEVRGGGRIDPMSNLPHHSEKGARSPEDAGLKMSPIDRAEARENALRKRENPEATKRANRIQSRFVGPTKRGIGRAINAANVARANAKQQMRQNQAENYDIVIAHLLDEGYCDSQDSAIKMMAAMSQDWIDAIVEEFVDPEHGETPSGRTPLENVANHPKKSVRKKAVKAFKDQMGKEYGGEWKSKSNDAR